MSSSPPPPHPMKSPSSRSRLLLFFLLLISEQTFADNFSFDFSSFSFLNLTLLGDSYFRNGSVGLTRESGVPCSSSGTAVYNNPIRFFDPRTNLSASFSTRFSFSITNANPESNGDGIAFFLSPRRDEVGRPGGYLGLFNSSALQNDDGYNKCSVIAVEFDTRMDLAFEDENANHVGFDVGGPISLNATLLDPFGINLKSGNLVTVWIDYYDDRKTLVIWADYTNDVKPQKPAMSLSYDLSRHFEEYMYIGFSGSMEGSTEVHTIYSWSFDTFGLPSVSMSSSSSSSSNASRGVFIPTTKQTSNSDNTIRKKLTLALGISCPVLFCCSIFILVLWFIIKGRVKDSSKGLDPDVLKRPRKFSYRELSIATRGFHPSKIVGNGAFGTVYRAVQPTTGATYAVKRSKHSHQGKSEFLAELSIIAGLRHKNLVQLQGWCDEKEELLLVYEFMPNGSLDKVLLYQGHGSTTTTTTTTFPWPRRCNVARGIASVLAYLHEECEQQVIHRDIKTSNIMLDGNLNPRLGDFGLARLTEHNESPVSTLTAGTIGYLAPEYLQYGKATEKTDVFSFGVVLLEVCCGRRPIEKAGDGNSDDMVNLVDWVWRLHAVDRLVEAADVRLGGEFDQEEMRRMLLTGLSCANPDCNARPSMRRVVQILNCEVGPMQVPKMKPCLTFAFGLPFSLNDIVSEGEEDTTTTINHVVQIRDPY